MVGAKYQAAFALGERVLQAQEYERAAAALYCHHPDSDEMRDAWLAARRLVEELTSIYLDSCEMGAENDPAPQLRFIPAQAHSDSTFRERLRI